MGHGRSADHGKLMDVDFCELGFAHVEVAVLEDATTMVATAVAEHTSCSSLGEPCEARNLQEDAVYAMVRDGPCLCFGPVTRSCPH